MLFYVVNSRKKKVVSVYLAWLWSLSEYENVWFLFNIKTILSKFTVFYFVLLPGLDISH